MICPECGSNTYFAQEFPAMRDLVARSRSEFHRQKAVQSELEWRVLTMEESMRSLQSKCARQSRAITRLEEKLRAAKQRPYEQDEEVKS